MADAKISALTALTGANLVAADILPVVDVSATTAGSKSITIQEFLTGILGSTSITGASEATSKPLINMAQTWTGGTGVTYKGIALTITDTSSNANSLLADFLVGATSQFAVVKNGAFGKLSNGNIHFPASNVINFNQAGGYTGIYVIWKFNSTVGMAGVAGAYYGWADTTNADSTIDTRIYRQAAGIIAPRGSALTTGGALELLEMTAPSAGGSNTVRIYAEDNGSGKTRLMAIFPTGAAQQIAIEP